MGETRDIEFTATVSAQHTQFNGPQNLSKINSATYLELPSVPEATVELSFSGYYKITSIEIAPRSKVKLEVQFNDRFAFEETLEATIVFLPEE
jgi:hypothetical protein